jgi:hypothetical protein
MCSLVNIFEPEGVLLKRAAYIDVVFIDYHVNSHLSHSYIVLSGDCRVSTWSLIDFDQTGNLDYSIT